MGGEKLVCLTFQKRVPRFFGILAVCLTFGGRGTHPDSRIARPTKLCSTNTYPFRDLVACFPRKVGFAFGWEFLGRGPTWAVRADLTDFWLNNAVTVDFYIKL